MESTTKSVSTAMSVIMKPPVYYFIVAVIIIKIMLLKYISNNILIVYRSIWFRIAFAILIALVAAYDYILATLLVACYVLAIQELNNRDLSSDNQTTSQQITGGGMLDNLMSLFGVNINATSTTTQPATVSSTIAPLIASGALVQPLKNGNLAGAPSATNNVNYTLKQTEAIDLINTINVAVDQSNKVPNANTLNIIGTTDPAFTTLTDNIMSKGFENLSLDQLNMPTTNIVYGVDPDKPIASSDNVLNAQGMEMKFPTGYDNTAVITSKC
jgi:hypothetical protein